MKNILIDCDPGHDDAIAILLALANEDRLNVLGITLVWGNQSLEEVGENAKKIVSVTNKKVSLVKGASGPIINNLSGVKQGLGSDIMNKIEFADISVDFEKINVIDFLKEKILCSKTKVTIVALGPLTNIALLLAAYPEVKENIEEITLMGGSAYTGNVTSAAEFNFYMDPHAAYMVYHSGVKIVQAGLEICYIASILNSEIEFLKGKGRVSNFVFELLKIHLEANKSIGKDRSPIFDACPVMYLLHPEIFKSKELYVDIEINGALTSGMSVIDTRSWVEIKPNTKVLVDVVREAFVRYIVEAINKLDK